MTRWPQSWQRDWTKKTAQLQGLLAFRGFLLSESFGDTMTSTFWRSAEHGHGGRPPVATVTDHPHRARREPGFDPSNPCRYCVESPPFRGRFGHLKEIDLFAVIASYCGAQGSGRLGQVEVLLRDNNRDPHILSFETFFNGHEALTLGYWLRPQQSILAIPGR